jgi:hypothetical protein
MFYITYLRKGISVRTTTAHNMGYGDACLNPDYTLHIPYHIPAHGALEDRGESISHENRCNICYITYHTPAHGALEHGGEHEQVLLKGRLRVAELGLVHGLLPDAEALQACEYLREIFKLTADMVVVRPGTPGRSP